MSKGLLQLFALANPKKYPNIWRAILTVDFLLNLMPFQKKYCYKCTVMFSEIFYLVKGYVLSVWNCR